MLEKASLTHVQQAFAGADRKRMDALCVLPRGRLPNILKLLTYFNPWRRLPVSRCHTNFSFIAQARSQPTSIFAYTPHSSPCVHRSCTRGSSHTHYALTLFLTLRDRSNSTDRTSHSLSSGRYKNERKKRRQRQKVSERRHDPRDPMQAVEASHLACRL